MSHTTRIESIVISDIDALNAAIAELKSEGVNCDLLEGVKARAYSVDQEGMKNPDMTLRMNDGRYDVGLFKTDDGKGYEARADFWDGSIQKQLGVNAGEDDNPNQAKMGKLYQKYAVHAASRKAVQQGMTVNRINNADGSVQLRIAV